MIDLNYTHPNSTTYAYLRFFISQWYLYKLHKMQTCDPSDNEKELPLDQEMTMWVDLTNHGSFLDTMSFLIISWVVFSDNILEL